MKHAAAAAAFLALLLPHAAAQSVRRGADAVLLVPSLAGFDGANAPGIDGDLVAATDEDLAPPDAPKPPVLFDQAGPAVVAAPKALRSQKDKFEAPSRKKQLRVGAEGKIVATAAMTPASKGSSAGAGLQGSPRPGDAEGYAKGVAKGSAKDGAEGGAQAKKIETTPKAGTGNLHQDDALVVDGSRGDPTVKEGGVFECGSDRDCGSGRLCDRAQLWQCRNKRGRNDACDEDRLCASGHCELYHCVQCVHDRECPGDDRLCDRFGGFRCVHKRGIGQVCDEDRLCRSGHCWLTQCRECHHDSHCGRDRYCGGGDFRCHDKAGLNALCDPTTVTSDVLGFNTPCKEGLSCYLVSLTEAKCLPSSDGCYARALENAIRSGISRNYSGVNDEAKGFLDNPGDVDAEYLVNMVTGNEGLLGRIRSAACATRDAVTQYMEEMRQCQRVNDFGSKIKLGGTQGLGADEEGPLSFVLMVGGSVDFSAGVVGASLGFGVAIEIDRDPRLALYVSACAGLSIGWEASTGLSAAVQFGGGLEATAGWATEVINPDISIGAGVGISFAFSNGDPSYVTLAASVGGGAGVDIDIMHPCYAWVSPSAQELLSAATCSSSAPSFTRQGAGFCADANGRGFACLIFKNEAQLGACEAKCLNAAATANLVLVGLEYNENQDECVCRFEGTVACTNDLPGDRCWNPSPFPTGPVTRTRTAPGWVCYKYAAHSLPAPV